VIIVPNRTAKPLASATVERTVGILCPKILRAANVEDRKREQGKGNGITVHVHKLKHDRVQRVLLDEKIDGAIGGVGRDAAGLVIAGRSRSAVGVDPAREG